MTDTERHEAAMRWLARNLAWSRRIEAHRDRVPHGPVVHRLARADREAHRHDRRHDRVA